MQNALVRAAIRHLEYFGYESHVAEDQEWVFVEHPHRADFFMREGTLGLRLVANFHVGAIADERLEEWWQLANRCNELSSFIKLALTRNDEGDYSIRVSATIPGRYQRKAFALAMDVWHRELDLMQAMRRPETAAEGESEEEDEEAEGGERRSPVTH